MRLTRQGVRDLGDRRKPIPLTVMPHRHEWLTFLFDDPHTGKHIYYRQCYRCGRIR